MQTCYLIDYENVKEKGLTGCLNLTAEDTICIFYTENAKSVSWDFFCNHGNAQLILKKVPTGDQSLDKHLVAWLGYLLGADRAQETEYVIVSKDLGFDRIIRFWKAEIGIAVRRCAQIEDHWKQQRQAAKVKEREMEEAAVEERIPQESRSVFSQTLPSEEAAFEDHRPRRRRYGRSRMRAEEEAAPDVLESADLGQSGSLLMKTEETAPEVYEPQQSQAVRPQEPETKMIREEIKEPLWSVCTVDEQVWDGQIAETGQQEETEHHSKVTVQAAQPIKLNWSVQQKEESWNVQPAEESGKDAESAEAALTEENAAESQPDEISQKEQASGEEAETGTARNSQPKKNPSRNNRRQRAPQSKNESRRKTNLNSEVQQVLARAGLPFHNGEINATAKLVSRNYWKDDALSMIHNELRKLYPEEYQDIYGRIKPIVEKYRKEQREERVQEAAEESQETEIEAAAAGENQPEISGESGMAEEPEFPVFIPGESQILPEDLEEAAEGLSAGLEEDKEIAEGPFTDLEEDREAVDESFVSPEEAAEGTFAGLEEASAISYGEPDSAADGLFIAEKAPEVPEGMQFSFVDEPGDIAAESADGGREAEVAAMDGGKAPEEETLAVSAESAEDESVSPEQPEDFASEPETNEIERILKNAGFPAETIADAAAIAARAQEESSPKRYAYRAVLQMFGRSTGLEIYRNIKDIL